MKAPIRAVLSAALKEVATRTTEQKLSDHTCEYFFPNFFFCSLVLLGGKFASEIFKLVLKRYAIKTHVKHTHRAYTRGKEEERDSESAFFLFTLSRSLSVVLCVCFKCRGKCEKFQISLKRYALYALTYTRYTR